MDDAFAPLKMRSARISLRLFRLLQSGVSATGASAATNILSLRVGVFIVRPHRFHGESGAFFKPAGRVAAWTVLL